ncbi:hypothetical protein [Marinobacter subterrani]|uniref:hypothetical protein n=1 Tax=Marinobacter subterrani TaxID=1658765 RepID=UPI0012E27C70|nr:hypothetical protein [Marinobacter subterrani]
MAPVQGTQVSGWRENIPRRPGWMRHAAIEGFQRTTGFRIDAWARHRHTARIQFQQAVVGRFGHASNVSPSRDAR